MDEIQKKPFYKKWWFIAIVVVVIIGAIASSGEDKPENVAVVSTGQVDPVADEGQKETADVKQPEEENSVEVAEDIKQVEEPKEVKVPKEYQSALKKASLYANSMHMSKKGLYEQLTSEYGENFSAEAAQYAVDNVKTDWKENALKKAITYQDSMAMSPNAIYDQLISEYGEEFTEGEVKYAIDNLPK